MDNKNLVFELLRPDDIEIRAQQITDRNRAILLLYKDARCDMRLLDKAVGQLGWQREPFEIKECLFCRVGIWDEEKREWVWKSDTGSPSNQEAEKGHSSDSFKRACFNWGIGRELYTAPFISIALNENEFYESKGKKYLNKNAFRVGDIIYEDKKIIYLTLVGIDNSIRFEWCESWSNLITREAKARIDAGIDRVLITEAIKTEYGKPNYSGVHDGDTAKKIISAIRGVKNNDK